MTPFGWTLLVLANANVVVFVVFVYDKLQARQGGWRVAEVTLWGLTLLGPVGSLLAIRLARHKTSKSSFLWRWWCCFVLGIGLNGLPVLQVLDLLG